MQAKYHNNNKIIMGYIYILLYIQPSHSRGNKKRKKIQRERDDGSLIPDFEEWIPGSCSYGNAVLCHTQTAHPVVVTSEDTHSFTLQSVPNIAVEVIIAGQQQTATLGEGHRCDPTHNHVMGIHHQLLHSSQAQRNSESEKNEVIIWGIMHSNNSMWEKWDA